MSGQLHAEADLSVIFVLKLFTSTDLSGMTFISSSKKTNQFDKIQNSWTYKVIPAFKK